MTVEEFLNHSLTKNDNKVHLQGIGLRDAKRAEEFKVGESILYNYGHTGKILAIETCGKTMLKFTTEENGKIYQSRKNKIRMMAYAV